MWVEVITDDELGRLGPAWMDLYRSTGSSNVFLTFNWISTLWRHCRRGSRLAVAVWEGPTLVAVAPLAVINAAGFRILGFIGHPVSNYEDVLAAPGHRAALRAIMETLKERVRCDLVRLTKLPDDSPSIAFFQDLARDPSARGDVYADGVSPYLPLSGTWDNYWHSLGKFRQNSRWRARRLVSELGPFVFVRPKDEGEVTQLLAGLIALQRARRIRLDGHNPLERPWVRDFYHDAALLAFRNGQLDLVAMRAGNETVAASMGVVEAGRYFGLLTAFDHRFAKYSPGRLLMLRLLEDSYGLGLSEFDFCIGASESKLHYRPLLRSLVSVFFYGESPRARLCPLWFGKVRPVLRDQQLLLDAGRRLRDSARRAWRTLRPPA